MKINILTFLSNLVARPPAFMASIRKRGAMMWKYRFPYRLAVSVLVASCAVVAMAQPPASQVAPGKTFTVEFPEMPPTMACLLDPGNTSKPSMAVFLPTNYNAKVRFPLLIFLKGGSGGNGNNPGAARKLVEDRDFICVDLPLFKNKAEGNAPTALGLTDADCRYMWSLHKRMLDKLSQFVPNIDPTHSVLGGFSNGSYATARMIVRSDGEVLKLFSAFIFVESGGQLLKPDLLALLKGRSVLVAYGSKSNRPERIQGIEQANKGAGVKIVTHEMKEIGHAFPENEYPVARDWLRNVVLKTAVNQEGKKE